MMTLEKTFLEQTMEQMKRNHQDELTAMISLYELVVFDDATLMMMIFL